MYYYYNKNIYCISKLFDNIAADTLQKKIKKAKIVFSIAMFYDLQNPLQFCKNIKKLIGDDGIWVSEQSYCPLMLKKNSFDTICHEHLEYYTIESIKYIFRKVGLKIIEIKSRHIFSTGIENDILNILEKYNFATYSIISSF